MFLLVTLCAVWLAWELRYVHKRQDTRKWAEEQGARTVSVSECRPPRPAPTATIPFWRRLLGDEAMQEVQLPHGSPEADLARIRQVFPEARSVVLPPPPSPASGIDMGITATYGPFPTSSDKSEEEH